MMNAPWPSWKRKVATIPPSAVMLARFYSPPPCVVAQTNAARLTPADLAAATYGPAIHVMCPRCCASPAPSLPLIC